MKNIILVIVVLLIFIGGLGWFIFTSDNLKEPPPKTKAAEDNNTKPIKVTDDNATKPTKADNNATKLTAEEQKVVGEYEHKRGEDTYRVVLLENGIAERYINGKKDEREFKWKITKEGELHYTYSNGYIMVYRINKDGSLTPIADISKFGKREEAPKEAQLTFKKIK